MIDTGGWLVGADERIDGLGTDDLDIRAFGTEHGVVDTGGGADG